jgi:uncharacterized protein
VPKHRVMFLMLIGMIAANLTMSRALAQVTMAPPTPTRIPVGELSISGYLFLPERSQRSPALLVMHGWGSNAEALEPVGNALARRGYVALTISMRGFGSTGGRDDCGLKQPDDAVRTIAWLGQHPRVDKDRIAVLGFSQGGQVALLTGARTNSIKAIVAYFPPTSLDRWAATTSHPQIPGYVRSTCTEAGGTAVRSPALQADRILAAVLLVHGDADTRVPTEQSILMRDALVAAKRTVELRLVPGAQHSFTPAERELSWSWTLEFLQANLGEGRR